MLALLVACGALAVSVVHWTREDAAKDRASSRSVLSPRYPALPVAAPGPGEEAEAPSPTPSETSSESEPDSLPPSGTELPAPIDPRIRSLLRAINQNADVLDGQFQIYRETCRPKYRSHIDPDDDRDGREWFAVWRAGPDLAWRDGAESPQSAPSADCGRLWAELVASAHRIAAALQRFEDEAHASGLSPERTRELLALHRLANWQEHFEREHTDRSTPFPSVRWSFPAAR